MATSAVCALLEDEALDGCSLSVSVSDAGGRYLAVNSVCASLLGLNPGTLEGVSDATLSPREFTKVLEANHRRALDGPQLLETTEWVLDRVGRRRVAACRFALLGADGRPWGVCRVAAGVEHAGMVVREAERLRSLAVERPSAPPVQAIVAPPDDRERLAAELAEARAERDTAIARIEALVAETGTLRVALDEATAQAAGAQAARSHADVARAEAEAIGRETRAELRRLAGDLARVTRERDGALASLRDREATADARPVVRVATASPPASPPAPPPRIDVAAALRELARMAGAQRDLDGVLRAAAAPFGRELGWDVAAAWRPSRPSGLLGCAGAWTDPSAGLEDFGTATWRAAVTPGTGRTGGVAVDGRPLWLADLSPDDPCPRIAAAARAGLRTAVVARVEGPEGPLGVIEAFARSSRPHDATSFDALVTAVELLGRLATLVARSGQPRWDSRR